jgi:aryl-alcohol dehydrogenase-like predicted oxidoreductase
VKHISLDGLEVSRLGHGYMGMSAYYTGAGVDDAESIRTIHRALDLGITLIDTAEVYGPYTNEELVGRAIRGRREKVVIATKFGIVRDPKNPMARGINGKPEYVRACCEASLRRLGTDHIDLYYQHRVDPNTPIEDTVGALADLVAEGKVMHIGLSEAGPATIRRAHAVHPVAALQTEYSLWTRDAETELLPLLRELGIGFVPYSPLGRGFLTGTIRSPDELADDDWRKHNPRFTEGNFEKNLRTVDEVEGRDRHAFTGVAALGNFQEPQRLALSGCWTDGVSMDAVPHEVIIRHGQLAVVVAAMVCVLYFDACQHAACR